MSTPTEYLNAGYEYMAQKIQIAGADEAMVRRLDLSKMAITKNLDRTAGGQLLRSIYANLAKILHPDKRHGIDKATAESELADLNNVYSGMKSLIAGKTPDRNYFTVLGIAEPLFMRIKPDTSYPKERSQQWDASSKGQLSTLDDTGWKQAARESLKRYRRAKYLGYGAAGLAVVAVVGVGSLPVASFYELAASAIMRRGLDWNLLTAVEHAYPTLASAGTIAGYGAAGVDLLRGEYSVVRDAVKKVVTDILRPTPR